MSPDPCNSAPCHQRLPPSILCSVKGIPGTLQEGGATFATAHWSVVEACADDDNADVALARLCQDYWPPLYTFARRRGDSSADAQDLVQGFFAYLLQTKAYAQTDRRRGKFRSFLLASFKNYMTDAWDKTRAIKRGGEHEFVLLNDEVEAAEALYRGVPTAMKLDEEQQYEQAWAGALAARALTRTRNEFENSAKARLFHGLKPFLTGGVGGNCDRNTKAEPDTQRNSHAAPAPNANAASYAAELRCNTVVEEQNEVAGTVHRAVLACLDATAR
jgi:RNA polymerase sigma factor (sigma-70 family)